MSSKRRIVMFNRVSADGYFSDPEGGLDWVVPEPEIDKAGAAAIPGMGTVLFGRRTYDAFESFWPHVDTQADTAPDPHRRGRHTPELRKMAVFLNAAEKIVLSRTRKSVTWENSRIVRAFDPGEIAALKNQPGKDILVFGSGSLVAQLTQHRLIDEYQFVVSPLLLGRGKSLLGDVPKSLALALLESRSYPTGTVLLRYGIK